MKRRTVLLLILFLASIWISAQNTKIFGLRDAGGIEHTYFTSFDYITGTNDTLIDFGSNLIHTNFWCTVDPFNGRYFFIGGIDTLPGYRLFTVNMNAATYTFSNAISGSALGDIEYDMFQNKLIFYNGDYFRSYDLATDIMIDMAPMQPCTSSISGTSRAYNFLQQEYMYVRNNGSDYYYTLIDGNNGNCIDSSNVTNPPFNYPPLMLVSNMNTNKYYGMINNGEIVEVDPISGDLTTIVQIPDWSAMLNQQQAGIDADLGYYFVPYYNNMSQNILATIDLATGTIIDTSVFNSDDFNKLYPKYSPRIKLLHDTLIVTYGVSYQWYKNDSILPGETAQKYPPQGPGVYKCSVRFLDGRTDISNEFGVGYTGLEGESTNTINVSAFPNPFTDFSTIDLGMLNGENFSIQLYNVSGQLISSFNEIQSSQIKVDRRNMKAGIYFFLVLQNNITVGKGKLVAAD